MGSRVAGLAGVAGVAGVANTDTHVKKKRLGPEDIPVIEVGGVKTWPCSMRGLAGGVVVVVAAVKVMAVLVRVVVVVMAQVVRPAKI